MAQKQPVVDQQALASLTKLLQEKGTTLLTVKVKTKASKSILTGIEFKNCEYFLNIQTKQKPENGLANEDIINILMKFIKVPNIKYQIIKGQQSSKKIIKASYDL